MNISSLRYFIVFITRYLDLFQHSQQAYLVFFKAAESGRPGRAQLLAKKRRIVGGVGCPPNCRTSGKLRGNFGEARGSSDPFELFRKMLHFGKIPKKNGEIWRKFSKICPNLGKFAKFWEKQKKIQRFLTKILRLESGAKECIV